MSGMLLLAGMECIGCTGGMYHGSAAGLSGLSLGSGYFKLCDVMSRQDSVGQSDAAQK